MIAPTANASDLMIFPAAVSRHATTRESKGLEIVFGFAFLSTTLSCFYFAATTFLG